MSEEYNCFCENKHHNIGYYDNGKYMMCPLCRAIAERHEQEQHNRWLREENAANLRAFAAISANRAKIEKRLFNIEEAVRDVVGDGEYATDEYGTPTVEKEKLDKLRFFLEKQDS